MNDFRETNPSDPRPPIDWSQLPEAARLRALADGELPAEDEAKLRETLDPALLERSLTHERELRRRLQTGSFAVSAPAELRDRVASATAAEQPNSEKSSESDFEPAVISRTSRSFWTQTRWLAGIAAIVALAATVWIVLPSPAPETPEGVFARAAEHLETEHAECILDEGHFARKMRSTEELSDPRGFVAERLGGVPVRLALGDHGYRLSGVGPCHVPGPGESVHLLYKPDGVEGEPISLFVQTAGQQHHGLREGVVYIAKDDSYRVRVWREADVIYYMVTTCPNACTTVENAYALTGERVTL